MMAKIDFKNFVTKALLFGAIISMLIFPSIAQASSSNLVTSAPIIKWILSSDSSSIYAVASSTGQLFCINTDDLTTKKVIKVGDSLQDIYLYKGIIYVSIPTAKQIVTIDEATLSIKDRYNTTADAYSIAVEDGKLFYAEGDKRCDIYEFNLTTGVDKQVAGMNYYNPDLEIDPVKHILYIGESGSSCSNLFAINSINHSKITESNYDNRYGFWYAERSVILNGNDIYYASRRFNASDLTQILNIYSPTPIFVNDKYVITSNFVYDKNSGEVLMDIPYKADLATIVGDKVFLYDSNAKTIKKYNSIDELNLLTKIEVLPKTITATAGKTSTLSVAAYFSDNRSSDVTERAKFTIDNPDVARISGNTYTALNAGKATITATYEGKTSTSTITVSAPDLLIDKMVTDNNKQLIYAISKVKYELDVISMDTLKVTNKIKFNSSPTDIDFYNGIIYVSLPYEKKIVTIDATTMVEGTRYNTTSDAYSIAVEDGKLFYATQSSCSYIYEFNLMTGVDKLTNLGSMNEPDIEIDPAKHILYIGETGSSGSEVYAVNSIDYSKITQSYGFGFPEKRLILNGNDIYYAAKRFNANDLTQILNTYSSTPIFTNDKYVITSNFVYDKNSGEVLMDIPYKADLATIVGNKVFLYDSNAKAIKKYNSIDELNLLTKIELSPNTITATAGQTSTLSVNAYFSDNRTSDVTERVNFTIDNPDVARISGNTVTALNAGKATITATYEGKTSTVTITVSAPDLLIDKMVTDNSKQLIYAISNLKCELDVISMDTLKVTNKIKFNSSPTDIDFYKGIIYVSLPYEKKIATINATTMTEGTCYNTKYNAYSIAVEDENLFYAEGDPWYYIYELNLTNGVDKRVEGMNYYNPSLEIDPVKHILYIGESDSCGNSLVAINSINYSKITQSNYDNRYGFGYHPERRVILNGNDVYYASRRFNASDLTQVLNTYSSTPIFANDKYVITNKTIYNVDGKIVTNLPEAKPIDLCLINDRGNFIYYSKDNKYLQKCNSIDSILTNITLTGAATITCSINKQTVAHYEVNFYDQYGRCTNPAEVAYSVYAENGKIQKGILVDESGNITINGIVANGNYKIRAEVKDNPSIFKELKITINNNVFKSSKIVNYACFYDGVTKLPLYSIPKNGTIEFSSLIKNDKNYYINVEVMLALYDSNGRLISFKNEPKTLKGLETTPFTLSVKNTQAGSYVKVFIWDGFSSMNPYCEALYFK